MKQLHFIGYMDTYDLIKWIDKKYTSLSGLCYYDPENKRLGSRSEDADFYYDPIHGVLEVQIHKIKILK